MALSAARVDIKVADSGSLNDAFIFGTTGDTSWSFLNMTFKMDVKGSTDDASPLLSMTTENGHILVDDVVNRILHFAVSQATIESSLVPGCYVYDLVMIDNSALPVRTPLMYGTLTVIHGATQE